MFDKPNRCRAISFLYVMEITTPLETALKQAAVDYADVVADAIRTEYPAVTDQQLAPLIEAIVSDWDRRTRPWITTADQIPGIITDIKTVTDEMAAGDVSAEKRNLLNDLINKYVILTGHEPTPDELA